MGRKQEKQRQRKVYQESFKNVRHGLSRKRMKVLSVNNSYLNDTTRDVRNCTIVTMSTSSSFHPS
jgi:hypothetical protein